MSRFNSVTLGLGPHQHHRHHHYNHHRLHTLSSVVPYKSRPYTAKQLSHRCLTQLLDTFHSQVPQTNFGSQQEGLPLHNSVDTLNTPTLVKPIPDFESLLQLTDLSEGNSLASWSEPDPIDLMYPMAETTEAYRVIHDLDRHMQDQDMTFYDDTPATIVIKPEKVEEVEQQQLQQQQQPQQLQQQAPVVYGQPQSEILQDEALNDIDDVTKEIESVCDRLNIPVCKYRNLSNF